LSQRLRGPQIGEAMQDARLAFRLMAQECNQPMVGGMRLR